MKHISGVHQDGAADVIVTFEKEGKVAHDFGTIKYYGVRPTEQQLKEYAVMKTGCATAEVTSYAIIDIGYDEDNYTCPNAEHVKPMNAPTAIEPNFYETQQPCQLLGMTVAKVKEVKLNQTTRTGQTFPNQ